MNLKRCIPTIMLVLSLIALLQTPVANAVFAQKLCWSNSTLVEYDGAALAFVAEGRIGLTGSDAEVVLGYQTGSPGIQDQASNDALWATSGQARDFTLTFNSATKLITWTIGGTTISFTYDESAGNSISISKITEIIIRARTSVTQTTGQQMDVFDLKLNGVAISETVSASGDFTGWDDVESNPCTSSGTWIDLLYIKSESLPDGFTLTGKATMTYTGAWASGDNTRSKVAFQIKLGDPEVSVSQERPIQQSESTPVGGITTPINRLMILTPYIALAGLIITISTIYVFKRRKA